MTSKETKEIKATVQNIIDKVQREGDHALVDYAKKFDGIDLSVRSLRVPPNRINDSVKTLDPDFRRALEACARRIQDFHWQEKKHAPQSWTYSKEGVRLGQIVSPIDSVGIYVPGGRFSYPSTLLMTAIPARLAGVQRIVVATPPGRLSKEILAAAKIAGAQEIYRVGGPAAIAALALGTKAIPKVDLIVGPGNALVTEAKRQLFGEVGIDLLAGPSELVVLADDSAKAEWVAEDLAAQAEHDPQSKGILIALSKDLIEKVKAQIPHGLLSQCQFFHEPDSESAAKLANEFSGEHVQLFLKRPQDCMDNLKNGGVFFINEWSPAAMGDYWAGCSHVLPTGRSARFSSGLSVMTFLKRSSLVEISRGAFKKGVRAAHQVAKYEGLQHHARSLRLRMEDTEGEFSN